MDAEINTADINAPPPHLEVVVVVDLEDAPDLAQRRTHRLRPLSVAALKHLFGWVAITFLKLRTLYKFSA